VLLARRELSGQRVLAVQGRVARALLGRRALLALQEAPAVQVRLEVRVRQDRQDRLEALVLQALSEARVRRELPVLQVA
jgi:hypothetical protein